MTSPTQAETTSPLEQYTTETSPKADDSGDRETGMDQVFEEAFASTAECSNTMDETTNNVGNRNDGTGATDGDNQY